MHEPKPLNQELAVPFCPIHEQVAPCLYCLSPEVGKVMMNTGKYYPGDIILFQQADFLDN